ncbi:ADP-ribosylglycohydrolase [Thermoanaerobacter uzonensis DSM 18761]|uniref:ADP-ribosylglycohydrolase n=1 Tax=Thermoanaerobacter uzonensis DSM 18761 TaxID=1123369 RepID=A0A1M4ZVU9_9THEO|nr:ADP-ribosylglycohydrolase family protein [Thermoanaerobacter uzonensis]SHF22149.1 ADP-ribosylglycohydrolase [Thermoanaerobacter uzonensis DSM 18761]
MKQLSLFDVNNKFLEKFQASLVFSGVGDSLGWPLEFSTSKPKKKIESFVKWKKKIGGRWWGYEEEIEPGEYSDDTQLMLSVARSIKSNGEFDPTYFAYLELPLWLNYERGGGKSIKSAAQNIIKREAFWFRNFYKTKEVQYLNAGANGAAMRNLPIALVNVNNEKRFIVDSIKNSLITHGHPRAILGSLIIGAAQIYLLKYNPDPIQELFKYIFYILHESVALIENSQDKEIAIWLKEVKNRYKVNIEKDFEKYFKEAQEFIQRIPDYLAKQDEEYYSFIKANNPSFKGSGISTTCAAIYMFIKYLRNPYEALINTANFVGSDTDTIASFVGSLIGAYFGFSVDPKLKELEARLQDREYIIKIGNNLWKTYTGDIEISESLLKVEKKESYLKILAWEIGLHELFWEALKEGDRVIHPTLGKGTIERKVIKQIPRKKDYVAKLFKIKFDCGQTAFFHSRVSTKNGLVLESMAREISNLLEK